MVLDPKFILKVALALLFAAGLSCVLTPLVKLVAKKIGAMDVPKDNRRMHTTPIPRMGGLAIFAGFLASVLIFGKIDRELQGILLGNVHAVAEDKMSPVRRLVELLRRAQLMPYARGVDIELVHRVRSAVLERQARCLLEAVCHLRKEQVPRCLPDNFLGGLSHPITECLIAEDVS